MCKKICYGSIVLKIFNVVDVNDGRGWGMRRSLIIVFFCANFCIRSEAKDRWITVFCTGVERIRFI